MSAAYSHLEIHSLVTSPSPTIATTASTWRPWQGVKSFGWGTGARGKGTRGRCNSRALSLVPSPCRDQPCAPIPPTSAKSERTKGQWNQYGPWYRVSSRIRHTNILGSGKAQDFTPSSSPLLGGSSCPQSASLGMDADLGASVLAGRCAPDPSQRSTLRRSGNANLGMSLLPCFGMGCL